MQHNKLLWKMEQLKHWFLLLRAKAEMKVCPALCAQGFHNSSVCIMFCKATQYLLDQLCPQDTRFSCATAWYLLQYTHHIRMVT